MSLPSRFNAWITLNRACNLRCKWCYAAASQFTPALNMSTDTFLQIVTLLSGLPIGRVMLIGGEPTIHPNFLEAVRTLKKAGMDVAVLSNSIKFEDNNFLRQTIEAGVSGIMTSIKGGNASDYLQGTGSPSAFTKVMRAISNIEASGTPHEVSVTVCESTMKSFADIIETVKTSGARRFLVDTERPVLLSGGLKPGNFPDCAKIAAFLMSTYPALVQSGLNFSIKVSIPFCHFPPSFIRQMREDNHLASGCQMINGSGLIFDPAGKLLACNHLCENPLGTLGLDFSDGEGYYAFRNRPDLTGFYKRMGTCPDQRCVECEHWTLCGGGCKLHWLCAGANELLGQYSEKGGKP